MKNARKLLSLMLAPTLIVSMLAGCSSSTAATTAATTTAGTTAAATTAATTEAATTAVETTAAAGTTTADSSQTTAAASANQDYDGTVYKIACDAAYAPFSIQLETGKTAPGTVVTTANNMGDYYGIDVELLDAIAKYEGFTYELTPMDFSAIIPALLSGTIDGSIAGMNITDERKEKVDFSDGYYASGSALVVNKDNTDITSFEDLDGKVAACKEGTTGMTWSQDNADTYGFTVTVYPDSASMMLAVANGQADFLIEDYPVISYQITIGEQADLKVAIDAIGEVPQNGFAVAKGKNATLLAMFNEGLAAIRANGTYDQIIAEYISD
ncbi:MAG: transporter substrate-binding domain-containing protein [Oscillospiraceae bacterium]|nr:transporter substrate-binding domain-containing protein [Oscillospiraceae bacterium]MDD4369052.1 transporter substrate-binding domain-containing protein [Oscillospiraceae bacterium]